MKCKGLIFYASPSTFITSAGFATSIRFNFIKKESCDGCIQCKDLFHKMESMKNINVKNVGDCEYKKYYRVDWDDEKEQFIVKPHVKKGKK